MKRHYSKPMLDAWEQTKAAYEALLWGNEHEVGNICNWVEYGGSCRLCRVFGRWHRQCNECILGPAGLNCNSGPQSRSYWQFRLPLKAELDDGHIIASAEVMEAAAAGYECILKLAWKNGVR